MIFASRPSVRQFALAQMLTAVILANMTPIFSKVLYARGWTPLGLYFMTLVIMSIILIAHEMMALERGARWGMTRKDLFGTLLSTLTGGVGSPILFFTGLQYVSASETVLFTSLLPFWVVLFGVIFFRERFTMQMGVGSVLLISAILILIWPNVTSVEFNPGIPFLLCSPILSALTTVIHKKYIKHRHLDSIIMTRTILSMIIIGFWIHLFDFESLEMLKTPQNIWLLLLVPVLGFIFPFFLYFGSLKHTKVTEAGVVAAAGRTFAVIAASTLLGEELTSIHILSITCVVFGVLFINVPLTKWRIVPSRLMEVGPLRK
ncbi:MAG: DMT family transporter [Candidatus Peribacteraceae bacterium]|nr:DMT family transporter [Candidatus Peribacteraceae bacterium]HCI03543.1 hypothetical protein [Candidatus Peribacteria bacterium]